jgi:hypothetical protein
MASITNYKHSGKAKLLIPVFFTLFPLLVSSIYRVFSKEAPSASLLALSVSWSILSLWRGYCL